MADRTEFENPSGPAKATGGTARHLFISYASHDVKLAQNVCSTLESAGFPCWMAPRDIVPGTLYADGIIRAINESTVLVLILSIHAIASSHVGKELERAASKRHPIIVLRADAAPLTPAFEYFLSESQWIEFGLDGSDAAIDKLLGAVRRHVLPGSSTAPATSPEARAGKRSSATPRRTWMIAGAFILFALAAVYFVARKVWPPVHNASAGRVEMGASNIISDKSIAVLPFADMSEKKDQEYFADGMAEEILDLLAKIPSIKVIGRTSSFQFKGKNEDLRTIGRQLGAEYVLEGSVRKAGNRVRITAQLIAAQTGTHRWSETYERDIEDVLKLQDEIAGGIARALQVTVGATDERSSILPDPAAYDIYLHGMHAFDRSDQDGFAAAADDFQQALDIDSNFAGAAEGLAATKMLQGEWGYVPAATAFEQGRRAAEIALRLNPKSALAHASLADMHLVYDWDWAGADKEIKQALALQPRSLSVLISAELAATLGHWDDAVRLTNDALAVDPLYASSYFVLGNIRWRSGHLEEAEAAMRRGLQLTPGYASGHMWIALVLVTRGQLNDALAEANLETDESSHAIALAIVHAAMGHKAESGAALAALTKKFADDQAYYIAEVYAVRRENDLAFTWLDRAYTQKDTSLYLIKGDPLLKNLEPDARFQAFLRKMNLPE